MLDLSGYELQIHGCSTRPIDMILTSKQLKYLLRQSPYRSLWRHQMETFPALLVICAGNSPVPGEFPAQRPVTRSFDVFFDLRLNKQLSKQSRGWWFETPSRSLWRQRNVMIDFRMKSTHYSRWWWHIDNKTMLHPITRVREKYSPKYIYDLLK